MLHTLALSSSLAALALSTPMHSRAAVALPRCRRRTAAPRCSERQDWLSTRVREALLDDAERLFTVWTEGEPRPLKVNLDLLANRARVLLRRGDESGAMETWQRCQVLPASPPRPAVRSMAAPLLPSSPSPLPSPGARPG